KYMYLDRICQTGDVILVEDEDVIEDIDIELYSKLVNCEVITEAGEPLGRVRDFQFNIDDGKVYSLIIASLGIPQIPEQLISTYELSIEEVVSSGPNRLIVFENSEERITQISVGLLERLGIGRPPWEREDEDYYPQTIKAENQLGTGTVRPPVSTPVETRTPVMEERWDEDEWQRAEIAPPPQQKAESIRYEEEYEEDNWGEIRAEEKVYEAKLDSDKYNNDYQSSEPPEDMWDDDIKSDSYTPPPVNIPEKQKAPEYEEEAG
nr:PRC-barrel domain-containing protein [Xenococcaceae cyanobacterium MO_188.B29]